MKRVEFNKKLNEVDEEGILEFVAEAKETVLKCYELFASNEGNKNNLK